ncbi:MAG: DUF433 domain-containing protein [Candidatus Competibacteraceae bacterium]|nr:DUF433 domain-containing protein [Candidatus Competibacteraceae bacterium]
MNTAKSLDGLIVRNPTVRNGRPVIEGTGTTVRAIAIMYKQGLTPENIIAKLPVNLAQVYAALTYYHLHTQEIEDDILVDSEEILSQKYVDTIVSMQ